MKNRRKGRLVSPVRRTLPLTFVRSVASMMTTLIRRVFFTARVVIYVVSVAKRILFTAIHA